MPGLKPDKENYLDLVNNLNKKNERTLMRVSGNDDV